MIKYLFRGEVQMTKVLEEMIEIYQPDDVDWMGFYRVKGNPYTFHHIREKCNKGKNELNNGAILTKNAHRLLNILEKDYPDAYRDYQNLFNVLMKVRHH